MLRAQKKCMRCEISPRHNVPVRAGAPHYVLWQQPLPSPHPLMPLLTCHSQLTERRWPKHTPVGWVSAAGNHSSGQQSTCTKTSQNTHTHDPPLPLLFAMAAWVICREANHSRGHQMSPPHSGRRLRRRRRRRLGRRLECGCDPPSDPGCLNGCGAFFAHSAKNCCDSSSPPSVSHVNLL